MAGGTLTAIGVHSHLRSPTMTTHAHFRSRIVGFGDRFDVCKKRKLVTAGTVVSESVRNGDEIHCRRLSVLFMAVGAM